MIRKAVILAAGKGSRMRELTQALPKPMLRVQGRPILEHIVEGLRSSGIRSCCIVTGHRRDVIESHFGDGSQFGIEITCVWQEIQDGTGKAPETAKPWVDQDPFLLTYGDILVQPNTYRRMVDRFAEGDFSGLLTVTRGEDVSLGGLNLFDSQFCLTRVVEKPSPAQLQDLRDQGLVQPGQPVWYNAGIYVFRPVVFDFTARLKISPRGEYELTDAINDMLQARHRIAGLEIEGRWVDVRDPGVLAQLERESGTQGSGLR